ncbi:MAG: peptidoglycan DD-metalloendopeptidase family protein [Firmicutes bacterium]|nr:peptidoglycan DD-metalloendopeptidase family protein [Bacillota bacterium]
MLSVLCLSAALQLTNQWQVVVDGDVVGAVKEREAIIDFLEELNNANRERYETASLINEVKIARSHGVPVVPTDELQLVLEDTLEWGIQGAVIAIDDQEVLALEDVTSANSVVENLKAKAKEQLERLYKNFKLVSLDIKEDIQVVEKPVAISKLVDETTAEAMLLAARRPQTRTVVSRSSTRRSTTESDSSAQTAATTASQSLVHVEATVEVTETKTVPYETKVIKDSSLYKGEKKTVTKGQNGTDEIVSVVTLVNGEVVDSTVKSTTRLKEPVTEVVKQGTKIPVVAGTGRFVWPTRGTISSRYGYRWGSFHRGLDIAAPAGTAIVAADSGVVTFAGKRGNYGLMVEIDHGNGYVTRYAHCSQLLVSRGAKVSRGQLIAKVGRTGFATGSHVHFEVLYRGANKDPLQYLR